VSFRRDPINGSEDGVTATRKSAKLRLGSTSFTAFRRIEQAELEMKRLVYGLGFAAKEHCAIAEKLLAEPPKERFDRIVVDHKVATRERHLKDLRGLVKEIRALDAQVGELYTRLQKAVSRGHGERPLAKLQNLKDVLALLSGRQRNILEMRFGLIDGDGHTLEEIGNL
jgi:DNA-directed RNA polymerase sigma subunit (sigma70/sigma32)